MTSLRGSADFRRVLEHGERYGDHLLALRALRCPQRAAPRPEGRGGGPQGLATHDAVRVGVSAGKGLGKAVQRNRVRRWLRESARAALRGYGRLTPEAHKSPSLPRLRRGCPLAAGEQHRARDDTSRLKHRRGKVGGPPVQGAWDLVFIPRSCARMVTHEQLRESVLRLLRRAGVSSDGE